MLLSSAIQLPILSQKGKNNEWAERVYIGKKENMD